MSRNFERGNQKCGFYDEDQLPHGGPERKRRGTDDDDTILKASVSNIPYLWYPVPKKISLSVYDGYSDIRNGYAIF